MSSHQHATIQTGGKQYRIKAGDLLVVEKLSVAEGEQVAFDRVLLLDGEQPAIVGAPLVSGASVKATVVSQFKGEKVRIFKMRRRKHYRKTMGHRQDLTKVRIDEILSPQN